MLFLSRCMFLWTFCSLIGVNHHVAMSQKAVQEEQSMSSLYSLEYEPTSAQITTSGYEITSADPSAIKSMPSASSVGAITTIKMPWWLQMITTPKDRKSSEIEYFTTSSNSSTHSSTEGDFLASDGEQPTGGHHPTTDNGWTGRKTDLHNIGSENVVGFGSDGDSPLHYTNAAYTMSGLYYSEENIVPDPENYSVSLEVQQSVTISKDLVTSYTETHMETTGEQFRHGDVVGTDSREDDQTYYTSEARSSTDLISREDGFIREDELSFEVSDKKRSIAAKADTTTFPEGTEGTSSLENMERESAPTYKRTMVATDGRSEWKTDSENTRFVDIDVSSTPELTTRPMRETSVHFVLDGSTTSSELYSSRLGSSSSINYYEYTDDMLIETATEEEDTKLEGQTSGIHTTLDYLWPSFGAESSPNIDEPEYVTDTSTEGSTLAPHCIGVTCSFGAVCHDGKCQCPPSCRHEVDPICANNGRTYMSECDMIAHMCVERVPLTVIAKGSCRLTATDDSLCTDVVCEYGAACIGGECKCPDECPSLVSPVCGNDAKTYGSECLLKRQACLQKADIRLRYKTACRNILPLTDVVIRESKEKDVVLDDVTLLVIYVCVGGAICVTLIVLFVVVAVNRLSLRVANDDEAVPLTSKPTKSAMRTSSSGSQQHRVTIEPRSESSPSRTPIINESGFTFTSHHLPNGRTEPGIPVRRPLSYTDTSVVEMVPDDDVRIDAEIPAVRMRIDKPENAKRNAPCRRHTSVTENSVFEVDPENVAILDDVFQNDEQIVTKL